MPSKKKSVKMNKKVWIALLMVGCSLTVAAEDGHGNEAKSAAPTAKYTFLSVAAPTADEVYKDLDADGLASRETVCMERKLKDCTFTREEVVPGESMQRTVTHKVDLYNAVRNIRKGLEKAVKAHPDEQAKAKATLHHVARVALAAFYDDESEAFEKALHDARKDYNRQIAIFNTVALDQ